VAEKKVFDLVSEGKGIVLGPVVGVLSSWNGADVPRRRTSAV